MCPPRAASKDEFFLSELDSHYRLIKLGDFEELRLKSPDLLLAEVLQNPLKLALFFFPLFVHVLALGYAKHCYMVCLGAVDSFLLIIHHVKLFQVLWVQNVLLDELPDQEVRNLEQLRTLGDLNIKEVQVIEVDFIILFGDKVGPELLFVLEHFQLSQVDIKRLMLEDVQNFLLALFHNLLCLFLLLCLMERQEHERYVEALVVLLNNASSFLLRHGGKYFFLKFIEDLVLFGHNERQRNKMRVCTRALDIFFGIQLLDLLSFFLFALSFAARLHELHPYHARPRGKLSAASK